MNNPFDEIEAAVHNARMLNRAVDRQANNLADLLAGRLKNVSEYHLKKLKKELRDFNIHTGRWKE